LSPADSRCFAGGSISGNAEGDASSPSPDEARAGKRMDRARIEWRSSAGRAWQRIHFASERPVGNRYEISGPDFDRTRLGDDTANFRRQISCSGYKKARVWREAAGEPSERRFSFGQSVLTIIARPWRNNYEWGI